MGKRTKKEDGKTRVKIEGKARREKKKRKGEERKIASRAFCRSTLPRRNALSLWDEVNGLI